MEDIDIEKLSAVIDGLIQDIGFSDEEASLTDISNALTTVGDLVSREGGKILLVVGNAQDYTPKPAENDKTNRKFFFSNDASFSRIAAELHKNLTAASLFIFGRNKPKNVASLGELTRLSGCELCYYDGVNEQNCGVKSDQVLQRYTVRRVQATNLGGRFPH